MGGVGPWLLLTRVICSIIGSAAVLFGVLMAFAPLILLRVSIACGAAVRRGDRWEDAISGFRCLGDSGGDYLISTLVAVPFIVLGVAMLRGARTTAPPTLRQATPRPAPTEQP
jgi:hypothetical protein